MGCHTLAAGDLTAVVGDNEADGLHRAGYNGLWSLTHVAEPVSPFVPPFAGMNLEHIFDGSGDERDVFEPRREPMSLAVDGDTVVLHQAPTTGFGLESWTRFQLLAPDYVDFEFRCVPRRDVFGFGYIGLFWASYINAPEDKSIYFLGGDDERRGWQQLCTQAHNDESTVCKRDHRVGLELADGHRNLLYTSLSPLMHDEPFFYGRFRDMTLLYLFDADEGFRITHSPSGGGADDTLNTTCPAWDFQFIIPEYRIGGEYSFKARLVYRRRMTRTEVVGEYEKFRRSG